jgi:hypothetical protein
VTSRAGVGTAAQPRRLHARRIPRGERIGAGGSAPRGSSIAALDASRRVRLATCAASARSAIEGGRAVDTSFRADPLRRLHAGAHRGPGSCPRCA